MKALLLSFAIVTAMIGGLSAQVIETPFGGIHGPLTPERHWHPGGGHWDHDRDYYDHGRRHRHHRHHHDDDYNED